jgi:transcriptional regulator with XRE-family HTH domain
MSTRPARRRQTIFVGSKIRQLRKERGLTQSELARRIGVQQSDLCRMENGEYKVSLDTLFSILSVFGMDIGEFFRDEVARTGSNDLDQELLRLFHGLDPRAQEEVLDFLRYKGTRRGEAWRN